MSSVREPSIGALCDLPSTDGHTLIKSAGAPIEVFFLISAAVPRVGWIRCVVAKKNQLEKAYRATIFERDNWKCWYCGNDITQATAETLNLPTIGTVDHVIPDSRGGSHDPSNLVTACKSCNTRKRNKTLEEYRHYIRYSKSEKGKCVLHLRLAQQLEPKIISELQQTIDKLESEIGTTTFYGEALDVS